MSLLDLHTADTLAAAPARVDQPRPEPKFSAWRALTAVPRGIGEAGAQVAASGAELLGGFGQVLGAYPEAVGYMPEGDARKQADAARARILNNGVDMNTPAGDAIRYAGETLRPDAQTAHAAEQVLYGFARGASKVLAGAVTAGPLGVAAAGLEEANTQAEDLRQKGVAFGPRVAAGAVQGAGLGLAALPAAGATLQGTAALYLAGGPGGFMAQQALTREILRRAGNDQVAEQFDPFDPVGLAVATLLPAGFAAYGLRANRAAAAAKAAEDFRTGPAPSERTAVAEAAAQTLPRDTVDAARVAYLTERRAAAQIHSFGDAGAAAAHEAALSRAEQQFAAGVRVDVADVVQPPAIDAVRALDTQVSSLEAERAALLPTAGQLAERGDIAAIRQERALLEKNRPDATDESVKALAKQIQAADGLSYKAALSEARRQTQEAVATFDARVARLEDAIRRNAEGQQASDRISAIDRQMADVRQQVADAAPFTAFRTAIAEAAQQAMRETPKPRSEPRATATPEAPNPEAAAAARSAGEPAPATRAAEPGRPAAEPQAPGLTPGDKAEAAQAHGRLAEIQAQHPDLMVQMDGMDKPMRLADFLAAVKADADEMLADAPLMELAAQCALLNGR